MTSNRRFFGCHVSAAGGLAQALSRGKELGVNTIQIHATAPQRWNFKPFPPGIEDEFLAERPGSGVEKVFFHGVYLINLAAAEKAKVSSAVSSLAHYLDLMDRIQGDGVIFHVGSAKDHENEEDAIEQCAEAITKILAKSPGQSKLLLEVAAGSGRIIGDRMEELRAIYDRLGRPVRVGFALDTQHMWASGYDLCGKLDDLVSEIDSVLGLQQVAAIHLNDSKTDFNSKADRHENLGQGKIGKAGLASLINHPRLRSIPVILETPAMKDLGTAAEEVQVLRGMIVQ